LQTYKVSLSLKIKLKKVKSDNKIKSQRNENVVVTGTSTGIGNGTAKELASRGFSVLAGVRCDIDADAICGKNIETVILDIANEAHIANLVD